MNLKRIKCIEIIGVFLLCFLCHFIYDWFPNSFTAIFFPVNESIWEHMKLLVTSYLLFGIIDYLILKKNKITIKNMIFQLFIVPVLGILIYLAIYLPLYLWLGEQMIINIILLFLVICLMEYLSYRLLTYEELTNGNIIGIIGIIATFVVFGYFVYKPYMNFLFFDTEHEKYGINIYQR